MILPIYIIFTLKGYKLNCPLFIKYIQLYRKDYKLNYYNSKSLEIGSSKYNDYIYI